MIPKLEKFYYVDSNDPEAPEASFFGIARCVKIHNKDSLGGRLYDPLYEFEHQDKNGDMCLSLFYSHEVMLEAQ